MLLKDKVAIITGAASARGLGFATAKLFAENGAKVVIIDLNGEASKTAAAALGEGHLGLAANVADEVQVQAAIEQILAKYGRVDVLVNNAGIARGGPLESMTLADIDALMNVNIRGVVIAIQEALVHMSDGGRIINIGSCLANRVAQPGIAVYSMTKSALNSLTRGLARDLGPRGITVNLVHPGPTNSDMNPEDGEQADSQRQLIALGHYGQPEDIAAAVTFLASPAAGQISGTGLDVDGGLNA